jgi:peroxiredoxin
VQPRIALCSVCHSQMPAGQTQCRNCGSVLCPQCRESLPQRSRFCPKCGYLCVPEQQVITPPIPPAIPGRPQGMPIPRPATASPQATPSPIPKQSTVFPRAAQSPTQQPMGGPAVQQRNCPKCGASIDHELGRCTGCGLLYGVKHRVMQQPASQPTPAMPQQASWPQSSMVQPPPAAYNSMPQYNAQRHSVSPPGSEHYSNYTPAATMPPGALMPIPRIAPSAPGTMSPGAPVPPQPYQYNAPPPGSTERPPTAPRKGGLSGFATMIIIVIVCFLVGSGVYYLFIRNTTEPVFNTVNNAVNSSLLSILDVTVQSTTENSATIRWTTDRPATGHITIYDSSGTLIADKESGGTLAPQQSVTIGGLQSSTKYNYTVISTDANGNEATSEGELTTQAISDKTPPTISAANVNVTESSAIITWVTNEDAIGQVKYAKVGGNTTTTPEETNLTKTHSVTLANLDSGTTYSFTIISKDAAGNAATSQGGQTFTTESSIPVGSNVYDRAPDFTVQNLNGDDVNIKLSDYRGKIVMINFWATWCIPCTEEMPLIQAISDNQSREDLVIMAIADNYEENLTSVNEFISEQQYTFPVYFDSQGQGKTLYAINTRPTTFFIDREGIIRYMQIGSFSNQEEIETLLNSLQ